MDQRSQAMSQFSGVRQKFAIVMNEVLDGLWVGNLRDASQLDETNPHNISALVSILDYRNSYSCENKNITHMKIDIADSPDQDVFAHFSSVNSFIHSQRLQGKRVLVHCVAGMSRSVCFVTAYLMAAVPTLDYVRALTFVENKRAGANPNFGFRMQLRKLDKVIKEERQRLCTEFEKDKERFEILQDKDISITNSVHLKDVLKEI